MSELAVGKRGYVMKLDADTISRITDSFANGKCGTHLGFRIDPLLSDMPRHLYLLKRFGKLFMNSAKVYLPVHFIVLLLRLRKSKGNKLQVLLRGIKEFIGSCLFGTCFAMSIPMSYCYISSLIPRAKYSWIGKIIGFIFSWAIFFDSSSRWGEMAVYVLAQWFEGGTHSLYKQKLIPVISHWEVREGVTFRSMCWRLRVRSSLTVTMTRRSCLREERSEAR